MLALRCLYEGVDEEAFVKGASVLELKGSRWSEPRGSATMKRGGLTLYVLKGSSMSLSLLNDQSNTSDLPLKEATVQMP